MPEKQKDSNVNEFNRFLENNKDFLEQKYIEYFKKKDLSLKQLNRETVIKFIYDVFSFSKYESDEKMNITLRKSLGKNIQDFLLEPAKAKKQFNSQTSVELLKYCIENNEMFAVKYDKKEKKIKTEEKQKVEEKKIEENEEKEENQIIQQPQEEQINQNQDGEDMKKEDQQKQEEKVKENHEDQNQFGMSNEFGVTQPTSHETNPLLMKKNLKQMFQFFCKQQQNVGAHTTFDRINHQCQTMTLGKFLSFCGDSEIKSTKIDRSLLMRKFKLSAEGKKEIEFETFFEIIKILAEIDQSIIPKLGVDDKTAFKNKMKERYKAFNTQDLSTRLQKKDAVFIPKLTAHSGKPSDALAEEIKVRKFLRKSQQSIPEAIPTRYQNSTKIKDVSQIKEPSKMKDVSQILSPNNVSSSRIQDFEEDLSFLHQIINAEENDGQWLKQYQFQLPKKKNYMPPRLLPRKQSIVPSIKKRVEELQKTQTKHSINFNQRILTEGKSKRSKSILS